jgi:hypothetical protein
MLELHFDTTKGGTAAASIHRAGCFHGRPNHVVVIPLDDDRDRAYRHPEVQDLLDRGWRVWFAPCSAPRS